MSIDSKLLEHILDVSRRMAETRALIPLLSYALERAIRLVGAERGYLVLVQPDGSLEFRVKLGQNGEELEQAEDQISSSVLNQVIGSGQPLILRDAMNDPHFGTAQSVLALQLRSIMCVPLNSGGQTLGAIYVENRSVRNRFRKDDLPPLVLFANQAAVAIENATLYEELEARVAARTRELEEAKSQVEKSWAEAVEANRLRTMWLGYVSHDLRAPLSVIIGTLQSFQDGILGDLDEEQLAWIDSTLQSAQHAFALVSDLLDFSKIEAGTVVLEREVVDLNEFLENVHHVCQGLPWSPGVEFQLDVAGPLPDVTMDPGRIQQVLLNLLSNAQQHTDQGAVALYARPQIEQNQVLIGVRDTGEGIPADRLELLFERFQQLDNTAKRQRGAGLGLAISRELISLHGGHIWAESSPGTGSDFVFALPVAP